MAKQRVTRTLSRKPKTCNETAGAHLFEQTFLESLETGGHGDDLDDFDPGNNPDFESDWQEAECGLSGDDDDF